MAAESLSLSVTLVLKILKHSFHRLYSLCVILHFVLLRLVTLTFLQLVRSRCLESIDFFDLYPSQWVCGSISLISRTEYGYFSSWYVPRLKYGYTHTK